MPTDIHVPGVGAHVDAGDHVHVPGAGAFQGAASGVVDKGGTSTLNISLGTSAQAVDPNAVRYGSGHIGIGIGIGV
jgi:hypothetical protein